MLDTLQTLVQHIAQWRPQIWSLALADLRKETRGTAGGWIWVFAKPLLYLVCFYFALSVGLRTSRGGLEGAEYFCWLACGIIPWFFLQKALQTGCKIFNKYNYLVTRIKFPIDIIPVFHQVALFLIHLLLLVVLFAIYFVTGNEPTILLVQLPFVALLMLLFGTAWSLMTAPLAAISADVAKLVEACMTPVFWLSGVLFDVASVDNQIIQTLLLFNPVTFFVGCYRRMFMGEDWIWSEPAFLAAGLGVVLVTAVLGLFAFKSLKEEIPDVL